MAGAVIPNQPHEDKAERGCSSYLVLGLGLAASLLACSCATPYKPLDHRYGYSEEPIGNAVYEVTFLGNANSSYERALDFAMLRAAEIALSRQARSFTLLDVVNLSSARRYLTSSYTYWTASPYLDPGDPTALLIAGPMDWMDWSYLVLEPAQERVYYRPGVKLKVQLLSDSPGSYYPYDPAKESERLRGKYNIRPGKR
jgi:hypothetical protein